MTEELTAIIKDWRNENAYNSEFHAWLGRLVNGDASLKSHRDYVEQFQFGFGDRPFHYVWKLLVDQMPLNFTFLEIGVFKAQVISLVALLAKETHRTALLHGVTTLDDSGDRRCKYPAGDYRQWINQIYTHFGLDLNSTNLHVGRSSQDEIRKEVSAFDPFNIVYIDGCHDYEEVVDDIRVYAPMTMASGFLVMDDSSNFLNIGTCWPGLEGVSEAVRDVLEPDERFKHLFACGHLRVFQRVQ